MSDKTTVEALPIWMSSEKTSVNALPIETSDETTIKALPIEMPDKTNVKALPIEMSQQIKDLKHDPVKKWSIYHWIESNPTQVIEEPSLQNNLAFNKVTRFACSLGFEVRLLSAGDHYELRISPPKSPPALPPTLSIDNNPETRIVPYVGPPAATDEPHPVQWKSDLRAVAAFASKHKFGLSVRRSKTVENRLWVSARKAVDYGGLWGLGEAFDRAMEVESEERRMFRARRDSAV